MIDRKIWGPLAERNFRLLFSARAISSFGDGIALVALTFAVLEFGDAGDLALVLLAREIPTVSLLLLGGVWADRLSRRKLLIVSDIARFGSQAATAFIVLAGTASTGSVAALQVLYGLGSAFFLPASASIVPQTVASERLQQANALMAFSRNSVGIAGPAAGAFLVVVAGPGWGLAVDAASFLLALMFLLPMRIEEPLRESTPNVLTELKGGWREFTARTWVWVIVGSFGIFQLAVFPAFMVLGPVISKNELGGAAAWGAILAATSVGSVAGSLAALRVRARRPLVLGQFLMLPVAVLLIMIGVAAPIELIVVAAAMTWACSEIGDTLWYTALQQNVPEEALGRISSFDYFGSQALRPIGFAIVAPLGALIGATGVMYGAAVILVVMAGAILLVPSVWQVGAEPEAATPA